MREIRTSGLMSGDGKRGSATAPVLDSTNVAGRWDYWDRTGTAASGCPLWYNLM